MAEQSSSINDLGMSTTSKISLTHLEILTSRFTDVLLPSPDKTDQVQHLMVTLGHTHTGTGILQVHPVFHPTSDEPGINIIISSSYTLANKYIACVAITRMTQVWRVLYCHQTQHDIYGSMIIYQHEQYS